MLRLLPVVALALILGFSTSVRAGEIESVGAPVAENFVDYFDGLRAWELGEKAVAIGMWLKAGGWGDVRAMQRLGSLYENGDNVPQDLELAYFWYSLSMKYGLYSSKVPAERVRAKLSPERLTSLESAASSWKSLPINSTSAPEQKRILTGADLIKAITNNDLSSFNDALSNGVSAKSKTSDGIPAIFVAAVSSEPTFVRKLLEAGAGPDERLSSGATALHFAAAAGQRSSIDALIASNARAAIQDSNGLWPSDYASKKGFSDISMLLKTRQHAELSGPEAFLLARGYFRENKLEDVVERDRAIRMYQRGNGLAVNGIIDDVTLSHLNSDARSDAPVTFHYVVRYNNPGKNWIGWKTFEEPYKSVALARSAAMEWCKRNAYTNCKFNFTPLGGCIAVSESDNGPYRVSKPQLSEDEASTDALNQCRAETDACKVIWKYCSGG